MRISMSERIWYASSMIAHGHDPSLTVAVA